MGVLVRASQILAIVGVFVSGWAGASLAHAPPPAPLPARVEVAETAPTTCSDPAAMEANANLVTEARTYRQRLANADEQRLAAEAKLAKFAAHDNERLAASADDWKRMASDGTVRLRMPCSSWNAASHFSFRRATNGRQGTHYFGSRSSERTQRAEAAGFSSEELEGLADVYHRVNAHTWEAVRAMCEATPEYRESRSGDDDPTDESRLATCRAVMVDIDQAESRTAIAHIATLRAAGASVESGASDRERFLFTLTGTQQALEDEMVRTFGREKTTRAIDNGVTCFDETLYDTHAPSEG